MCLLANGLTHRTKQTNIAGKASNRPNLPAKAVIPVIIGYKASRRLKTDSRGLVALTAVQLENWGLTIAKICL